MFQILAHASLGVQIAFSCLLICLLDFYYRRVERAPWLRWFAGVWAVQAIYVVSLWAVFDHPSGSLAMRLVTAILGFLAPPTIVLTSLALWQERQISRTWIAGLYTVGLIGALFTVVVALPYPIDSAVLPRIHNVPRHACYGLASLMAAVAFARYARGRKLTGAAVTAGAWGFYGILNLVRAEQWYAAPEWALRGAENRPDLIEFALITFLTNSLVWIVMCLGVGLLLTENAERSEKRTRQALGELEAAQAERGRLARLVERSRDAILVISKGQVCYLNDAAARLLGFTAEQIPSLLMQPVEEVCGIGAGDAMRMRMDAAISSDGVWEGESEWSNRATGERIPMLVGAVGMEAREGEPPSTGLIGRDLRERLRLDEDLRQAQRQEALGRLAGGIAHDFNNLLTVIMGYSSLVLQDELSDRLRKSISEILLAARRAAAITDRLRAFGRRQALHATVFDLNGMVDSMRGSLEKMVEGEVTLAYELHGSPLMVRADAAQIEQVLMNLVLNAAQSIEGPGRVVVRTGQADAKEASGDSAREFAKIDVEDTGSGIEPDVLEHIFDPYFTTRAAGSGLGLSMAYGIVKQSGGQMRVSSQPGSGSVFTVLLPVTTATETNGTGPPAPVRGGAAQGDEMVMIVDDRPDVTAFVSACLSTYGYRTIAHTDSESALAALGDGNCAAQLVIRDVMMPGMVLQEFAGRVRELSPGMPMVFMSGLPEASIAPLLEGTGGYFIAKPFAPEQLATLVRRVLDAAAILAAR